MKKTIFILALSFFGFSNAQESLEYGVTANFHKGSIVNVHDVSKGKFGGGLGFFLNFPLTSGDVYGEQFLYLMPQIEYSMQGEYAKAEGGRFGTQKFPADYLAAMLYLKYYFHPGQIKNDVFAFLGPRVEYMINHKKEVDPGYEAVYYQFNLDNNMNKLGFGLSGGVGLQINPEFDAFLRYDQGFSKVYPDNPARTYNRLLALGINYYFGKGSR